MMISVITLFPDLYAQFVRASLIGKAVEKGVLSFDVQSLFSVCAPKERVDAPTFGHHAGMAIRPEVVERMVDQQEAKHGRAYKIFFSPRGERLTQDLVRRIHQEAASFSHIACFAARYEGMDDRIEEEYADCTISLGDFVLLGGDIPLQAFLEAYVRYVPGVVGQRESVERDSFTGVFVDAPTYTAPATWRGRTVPEVVRSGNHGAIVQWEQEHAANESVKRHFAWVRSHEPTQQERALIARAIPPHYVVLMHDEIMLPGDGVGTTSVTSIDIHDIARSATTYGLRGYHLVTPLRDQQAIVQTLLSFWQEGDGIDYNPSRAEALRRTVLSSSLDETLTAIEAAEGQRPIVIATSARPTIDTPRITYHDQAKVWESGRPVVLILGTGRGLAPSVYTRVDYALIPVNGYTAFNHLSVRSAAAIIFDRWLGCNPSAVPDPNKNVTKL